jgi:predicted Fe-Mo cluster-binding NifX family protein
MATRVAVASRDNVVVHQHFGRATHFQIYDLSNDGFTFVETRENTPTCGSGSEVEAESHQRVIDLLKDCSAVVVARIGPGAIEVLNTHGLKHYVFPENIDTVLRKLATASS